jgi:hypothetical protein
MSMPHIREPIEKSSRSSQQGADAERSDPLSRLLER